MKKKCTILLLESETGVLTLGEHIQWNILGAFRGTKFHLYFISDDEIQVGDFIECRRTNQVIAVNIKPVDGKYPEWWRKIIATTDDSLCSLPTLSKDFIQKYCEVGGIDEVMVEFSEINNNPKVNHNFEISISKVKETWTREEHCTDMQYYMEYCQANGYVTPMKWLDELKHY